MILAAFLIASCGTTPTIEYRNILPDLPDELRTPVKVPERRAETLADVGVILSDHVQALDTANGKIVAVDCIWQEAEARAAGGAVRLDCLKDNPETRK